jgi:hypothetical protein
MLPHDTEPLCVAVEEGDISKIILLLDSGASVLPSSTMPPLHRAAMLGSLNIGDILLQHEQGRFIRLQLEARDQGGDIALHIALRPGNLISDDARFNFVDMLLEYHEMIHSRKEMVKVIHTSVQIINDQILQMLRQHSGNKNTAQKSANHSYVHYKTKKLVELRDRLQSVPLSEKSRL